MWGSAYQPLKSKVIFACVSAPRQRGCMNIHSHNHFTSPRWPRYGEVDRQIWLSYFGRADLPSLLLSLYWKALGGEVFACSHFPYIPLVLTKCDYNIKLFFLAYQNLSFQAGIPYLKSRIHETLHWISRSMWIEAPIPFLFFFCIKKYRKAKINLREGTFFCCFVLAVKHFILEGDKQFSKHRPSGPMLSISPCVRLSVCLFVHFWGTV